MPNLKRTYHPREGLLF